MAISRHNLVPDLPDNNFATMSKNGGQYTDILALSEGNLKLTDGSSGASINYAQRVVSSIPGNMNQSFYFEWFNSAFGGSSGNICLLYTSPSPRDRG